MLQGPEFLGPQARGRGVIPRGPIEIEESGINDDDDGSGPNINHFIKLNPQRNRSTRTAAPATVPLFAP
jgi:hypothetical protein